MNASFGEEPYMLSRDLRGKPIHWHVAYAETSTQGSAPALRPLKPGEQPDVYLVPASTWKKCETIMLKELEEI
jgi:hypothetical protein